MALTMNERKERYYKLVLEKANEMYATWQTNSIRSKRLVAQANEYAFDNRLKIDAFFRFRVLVFVVALEIRLEKRYGTFFRRLFRIFAYIRERSALRMLKRVFGYQSYTDIREMIELEAEKIILLFSQQKNRRSTGGGKRAEIGDIMLEDQLNSFLQECIQEDEQKALDNNVATDKIEKLKVDGESFPVKADETQREKISVEEFAQGEHVGDQKKDTNAPTKVEQTEKQTTKATETDIVENDKIEKPVEKTVVSTSILAETILLAQEQEKDLPSPFPVFREHSEGKIADSGNLEKENNGTKIERENAEKPDKNIHIETDREKTPFPVFHGEKTGEVKAPENVAEKEIKEVRENKASKESTGITDITDITGSAEITDFEILHKPTVDVLANISEENKARISLNVTMSKEEIQAITAQLKAAANIEMEKQEQAWREKISIANGDNEIKASVKETATVSHQGTIASGLKK